MAPCTEMAGRALLVAVLCCGNLVAALPDVIRIGQYLWWFTWPGPDSNRVLHNYKL